jgi:hypothetical protein
LQRSAALVKFSVSLTAKKYRIWCISIAGHSLRSYVSTQTCLAVGTITYRVLGDQAVHSSRRHWFSWFTWESS